MNEQNEKQNNTELPTEVQAISTMVKLSRTVIKRGGYDERMRAALLNTLDAFAKDFIPDYEDGCAHSHSCDCEHEHSHEQVSRYALVFTVVQAASSDLKALWYIFYPYLVVSQPHIETELYEGTKKLLSSDEVLEAVLTSRYSFLIAQNEAELSAAGLSGVYEEWYAPYRDYIAQADGEDTREVAHIKKLLAGGRFAEAKALSEHYLDLHPFDNNVQLLNIAARVSLQGGGGASGARDINETIELINGFLDTAEDKRSITYLHYYRGLCKLGLAAFSPEYVGEAKADFDECLKLIPDFQLAAFMLKAIDAKLEEK